MFRDELANASRVSFKSSVINLIIFYHAIVSRNLKWVSVHCAKLTDHEALCFIVAKFHRSNEFLLLTLTVLRSSNYVGTILIKNVERWHLSILNVSYN